jgi:hypothetical protein
VQGILIIVGEDMQKHFISFLILLVLSVVSCSGKGTKTEDESVADHDSPVTDEETHDHDSTVTDDESPLVDEDSPVSDDNEKEDSEETDDDSPLTDDESEDSDEEETPGECTAPSEVADYSTKPYARMRIYIDVEKIEEYESADDDELNDDDYPEGYDLYFKSEYNEASWETENQYMSAIIMPDFEDDEDPFNNILFVEGTEITENENDERWFMFMMDASILQKMKADNVHQQSFEEKAMIFIKRETKTEAMTKSCLEAIFKKGVVYACDHDKTSYGIYNSLNLWIALDLETDEAEILSKTEYDNLCECHDLDGIPVDCD